MRAQTPLVRGRAKVGAQIYVTDADRGLVGVVEFQDLVLAVPDQRVSELIDDDPVWASPLVDAEDAALALVDNDLAVLPIVDESRRLIGVLSAESAVDILECPGVRSGDRRHRPRHVAAAGRPVGAARLSRRNDRLPAAGRPA